MGPCTCIACRGWALLVEMGNPMIWVPPQLGLVPLSHGGLCPSATDVSVGLSVASTVISFQRSSNRPDQCASKARPVVLRHRGTHHTLRRQTL